MASPRHVANSSKRCPRTLKTQAPTEGGVLEGVDPGALAVLGLSPNDEQAYLALLQHTGATGEHLAQMIGVGREAAAEALERLELHGLVSRRPERPTRFSALPPDVCLRALLLRRQQGLQRAESAVRALELFARAAEDSRRGSSTDSAVEVITSPEAAKEMYRRLESSAQTEVLAFDRPPYFSRAMEELGPVNEAEQEALERGVRWRGVYAQSALELPGRPQHIQRMVALGEEARAYPTLPLKLEVVDRRIAVVPLDLSDPLLGGGTLIVRSSALLVTLVFLFETIWERATPMLMGAHSAHPGDRESTGADAKEVDAVITLMASGVNDVAIARALKMSKRTVDRRVRAVMHSVDARTRFQAGYELGVRAASGRRPT